MTKQAKRISRRGFCTQAGLASGSLLAATSMAALVQRSAIPLRKAGLPA